MIFHNDTPDTTMDEDLAALGLPTLMESIQAPAAVRALTEDDDEDDKDDDEGEDEERTDVEVGKEEDVNGDDRPLTEDEIVGLQNEIYQLAASYGVEESDFVDFIEYISEETDTEFDALFEESMFLYEEDDEDEDEDEQDEDIDFSADPKMEAAAMVLAMFGEQISALQEDDDVEHPSYDDLVGVIEAYEYISEGLLHEGSKRSLAKRALRFARRKMKRLKRMGKGLKSTVKAAKRGMVRVGGKFMKAGARAAQGFRKMMQKAGSAIMKRKWRKRLKAAKKTDARSVRAKARGMKMASDVEVDSNDALAEMEYHLDDIRSTLSEGELEEMVENVSNELLSGLKAIHDASTGYYEAIAEELNEHDEAIDEDDDRVAMGRHLESIAQDAYRVAELISEGEADLDDAADDLQSLAADLDDALEAMKGIE